MKKPYCFRGSLFRSEPIVYAFFRIKIRWSESGDVNCLLWKRKFFWNWDQCYPKNVYMSHNEHLLQSQIENLDCNHQVCQSNAEGRRNLTSRSTIS